MTAARPNHLNATKQHAQTQLDSYYAQKLDIKKHFVTN